MTIAQVLLPAKFMTLMLHLLMITVGMYSRADNILAGISNRASISSKEYIDAEDSVILCSIFMLVFSGLEFLFMFFGLTILNHQINLINTLFHSVGTILVIWYTFENWSYKTFWGLFWAFSLPPFVLEFLGSVRSFLFYKKYK